MNTFGNNSPVRQPAVHGLAVVGFITLIILGIWLAVYSTRFVPTVVDRIGSAAVYVGSVFSPAPKAGLSVVSPEASTTIPFGTTEPVATSTATTTVTLPEAPKKVATVPTTAGTETSEVTQIGGTTAAPYGLSDLRTTITAVGYLATTSTNSFVASTTAPLGTRPAVSFTVKNVGTNVSGTWRFSASIPTQTSYVYTSQPQQALNPGDSIDYVLGFDQALVGANRAITIVANFDNAVTESTTSNNTASTTITIQ